MKSLLDIQQDVRGLESSVRDIAKSIKEIYSDIDELRNADRDPAVDFSRIKVLAGRFSFRQHPIARLQDGRLCQLYLEMLLNIARMDLEQESLINRLVFIQWLQIQARIDWELARLYLACFKMDRTEYREFAEGLTRKYRESFIVDALITAYIADIPNRGILEYITEQSLLLGVDRERLRVLSVIPRTVLCQNMNGVPKSSVNEFLKSAISYRHYLDNPAIEKVLESLRDVAVEVRDEDCTDFVWKVGKLCEVKKGDVLAVCRMKVKTRQSTLRYTYKELRATSSGILFRFWHQRTRYGVIAHGSDDLESVKVWTLSRR